MTRRTLTVEGVEQRLDRIAAAALRRASDRLDAEHSTAEEKTRGMANARAVIRAWRERATAAALAAAPSAGRSA